jgi:hypothetical protein
MGRSALMKQLVRHLQRHLHSKKRQGSFLPASLWMRYKAIE